MGITCEVEMNDELVQNVKRLKNEQSLAHFLCLIVQVQDSTVCVCSMLSMGNWVIFGQNI